MRFPRGRARRLALILLVLLPSGACGRRGPPVAPELRLPVAVTDLTGVVRPAGIDLMWSLPDRRVDGTRLRDLTAATVYRSDDDGRGEPRSALLQRGRIPGYTEVIRIALDAPAPATLEGSRLQVLDRRGLVLGRRYTYVVVSEDASGRISPPSGRRALTFIAAPEPPAGVVARAGDTEVRLVWQGPSRLVDGSPALEPLTYEVLRGVGGTPPAPLPHPRLTETALVDRGLDNEQTYTYAVRAVRVAADTRAVGDPSPPVAATPVDTTPPSAPRDLVAIPSERTVRLSWRASPEPDVAGYVIYRGRGPGDLARIGSTAATVTTFIDREAPSGRVIYTVTAVDTSSRQNESARSDVVAVSVP